MKAVIVVEGGIVQEVISDEKSVDIVVVDHDTEDMDESEVKHVEGWRSYVYNGLRRFLKK